MLDRVGCVVRVGVVVLVGLVDLEGEVFVLLGELVDPLLTRLVVVALGCVFVFEREGVALCDGVVLLVLDLVVLVGVAEGVVFGDVDC